jgi:hypothetical protein
MNDEMNQFEQKLKRQQLRPVPASWREEILSVAKAAQPFVAQISKPVVSPISKSANYADGLRAVKPATQQTWKSALQFVSHRLTSLLWPHPVAWGGLAAIWIFIFAANVSSRDQAPVAAEKVSSPSPEMLAELRQQQRLFVELIGASDVKDADRPKVYLPAPRSERMDILMA